MKRIRFVLLVVALAAGAGCAKVKPGAYQVAVTRYYRGLLGGVTEESLSGAIRTLSEDLQKHPADTGLVMLRTSARLDLLRLGVTKERRFAADRAQAFFEDLRLLQGLLDGAGERQAWIAPRVQTMFGDAVLLQTQAMGDAAGEAAVRQSVVQMQLFRLACDAYLRATAMSGKTTGVAAEQTAALGQEADKARDGYLNALTGLAQSELALRLTAAGRQHLVEAQAVANGGALPVTTGAWKLDGQAHRLQAAQLAALETLTNETAAEYASRVEFAMGALREEAAARLLASPVEGVSAGTIAASATIPVYLAGTTMPPTEVAFPGGDSITFTLRTDPLYAAAKIPASVPFLTLAVGTETIPVRLADQAMVVRPEGLRVTVMGGDGAAVVAPDAVTVFLGRKTPLLVKDKLVVLTGPGGNKLAEKAAP